MDRHLHPTHPLLTSKRANSFRARVARMSMSHFTIVMGTGVIGSLLLDVGTAWGHGQRVLQGFAAAFYVLAAALFLVFSAMSVLRYVWFPEIWTVMISHETHSLYLACVPMGFVTIVSGIASLSVAWGWPHFGLFFASGLWWFALLQALLIAFGVPWAMFSLQTQRLETMTALWLLPVVPTVTVASVGSTIADFLIPINPSYSLTILLASYILLGIGLLLSVIILVSYFLRLAVHHLPPRELIVSTFLPLGPCGQGGFAIVQLGRVARDLFPVLRATSEGGEAVQTMQGAGEAMYGTGLVWGFLLWGLGIWWLVLAVASVVTVMYRSKAGFSMAFWGFTFPLGSLNLLTYALGNAFDSPFFKAFGSMLTGSVVLLWAGCAGPTAYGWWTGSLFDAPCLSRLPRLVAGPDGKVVPKLDEEEKVDQEREMDGVGQDGDAADGLKGITDQA